MLYCSKPIVKIINFFIFFLCIKIYLYILSINITSIIYKELNINNLKFIFNLSTLVDIFKHKHLIIFSNHKYNTRYRQNVNICLTN